jgi:hypothetical protein
MPSIDLSDEEHAALAAYVLDKLREEKFPHAPRLDPVRSALAKLDPSSVPRLRPSLSSLPQAGPIHGNGRGKARRQ